MESRTGVWIAILLAVIGAAQVSSHRPGSNASGGTSSSRSSSDSYRSHSSSDSTDHEASQSDGKSDATWPPEVMPEWYNPIAPLREFLEDIPRYRLKDFLTGAGPGPQANTSDTPEPGMGLFSEQLSKLRRVIEILLANLASKVTKAGKPSEPGQPAGSATRPVAAGREHRLARHHCEFIIATVADPLNSRFGSLFDSQVTAIQQAAAKAGWHLDRYLFPWSLPSYADERAGRRIRTSRFYRSASLARQVPGVILFRKSRSSCPQSSMTDADKLPELLIVFLVGETATYGVHHQPFLTSLDFIEWVRKQQGDKDNDNDFEFRILGPTYSGSQQSLESLISDWSLAQIRQRKKVKERASQTVPARLLGGSSSLNQGKSPSSLRFRIYSGGATSIDLCKFKDHCLPAEITFCSTVVPDEEMLPALLKYLNQRSGYEDKDKDKVKDAKYACLVESGTGYGSRASDTIEGKDGESDLPHVVQIPFPMHISLVRGVATRQGRAKATPEVLSQLQADPYGIPIPFDNEGNTRDIIPPFSPSLTAASEDLVLGQIMATLDQENFSVIGIMASDLRDQVFLAQLIHDHCPHAQLFTTGANLLHTHHQFNVDLRGMLVATTYPLHTRTQTWKGGGDATQPSKPGTRIQFSGETIQGTYNAMLALLDKPLELLCYDNAGVLTDKLNDEPASDVCNAQTASPSPARHGRHPSLWISVVGRDGIYPLSRQPIFNRKHYMYEIPLRNVTAGETGATAETVTIAARTRKPKSSGQSAAETSWWSWLDSMWSRLCLSLRSWWSETGSELQSRSSILSWWWSWLGAMVRSWSSGLWPWPWSGLGPYCSWLTPLKNRWTDGDRSAFMFLATSFFCFVLYVGGTVLPQSTVFELLRVRVARWLGLQVSDRKPQLSDATTVTALPVGDSKSVSKMQGWLRKWCSDRRIRMVQKDFYVAVCLIPSLAVLILLAVACCTVRWNFWELRTTNLSSGLSITIPAVCIAGVLYLWGEMHLKRLHTVARDLLPIPFPVPEPPTRPERLLGGRFSSDDRTGLDNDSEVAKHCSKLVKRCREVEVEVQHPLISGLMMYRMWNGGKASANESKENVREGKWSVIGLVVATLLMATMFFRFTPTLEWYLISMSVQFGLAVGLSLLVVTSFQFYAHWARIQRVCERIAELRMLSAFDRLPQVMSNVLGRLMSASRQAELHRQIALQQLYMLPRNPENPDSDFSDEDYLSEYCRTPFDADQTVNGHGDPGTSQDMAASSGEDGPEERRQQDRALAAASRRCLRALEPLWDGLPIHLAYSDFHEGGSPGAQKPSGHRQSNRERTPQNYEMGVTLTTNDGYGPKESGAVALVERPHKNTTPEIPEEGRLAMEDFVAIQIIRYLAPLFVQLRNLRTFLIVAPLLLLVAFGSYPFHIRGMLPVLWVTTLGIVGVVMLVFMQIECNELVSRISRTSPNRLTFDRTFWSSLAVCLVPLVTFLAWQFRGMSGTLSSWIESLMN